MNEERPVLTFGEYVGIVWRRRRLALLVAGLFACATFIVFNFVPRKYSAQTVFERRGDAASRVGQGIPESFNSLKPIMRFELTGAPAIRKALDDLGYTKTLTRDSDGQLPPDAAGRLATMISQIQSELEPVWIVNSDSRDRVSLTFTSTDPALTQKLPNQLVASYITNTRKQLVENLSGSCTFLSDQLNASREKLTKLREERLVFAMAHPDMLSGDPQSFIDRQAVAQGELSKLREQRNALEAQLATLSGLQENRQSPGNSDPSAVANPEYAAAQALVQQFRKELDATVAEGMTDKHPKMIKLTLALKAAEEQLHNTPVKLTPAGVSPVKAENDSLAVAVSQIRTDLARLDNELTRRQQTCDRLETMQTELMPLTKEHQRLSAMIQDTEAEVSRWQRSQAELQMALDAERNDTRTHLGVVKLADPVYQPVWPPLWLVFGLALGGGLVVGIVVAILRDRMARSFGCADQLSTALDLPLLGIVGPILSPTARRTKTLQRYALAPAVATILLAVMTVAATGVVMSMRYPGKHSEIMEQVYPTARLFWTGTQSLLG